MVGEAGRLWEKNELEMQGIERLPLIFNLLKLNRPKLNDFHFNGKIIFLFLHLEFLECMLKRSESLRPNYYIYLAPSIIFLAPGGLNSVKGYARLPHEHII